MRARTMANINDNKVLLIGVFSLAVVIFGVLLYFSEKGSRWGDLLALSGAIVGILVMMKGEEGGEPPLVEEEDAA